MSLLIKNAKLISNGVDVIKNILIEDGIIKKIGSGRHVRENSQV